MIFLVLIPFRIKSLNLIISKDTILKRLKAFLISLPLCFTAHTMSANNNFPSMIQVSGTCKKRVPTNRSRLHISVENSGKEMNELYQKTTKTYNSLYKIIKNLKLKNSEVETSSYQVKKEFDWHKGKKIFRGFKVSLSLTVSSSETQKMTTIIQEANRLKISNVRGLQQFVSDSKIMKIKSECLKKAVLDAQTKALSMAQALGRKLGKHFRIIEGLKDPNSPRPMNKRLGKLEMFSMQSISDRQGQPAVVAKGHRTFHFHVTGEFGVQ